MNHFFKQTLKSQVLAKKYFCPDKIMSKILLKCSLTSLGMPNTKPISTSFLFKARYPSSLIIFWQLKFDPVLNVPDTRGNTPTFLLVHIKFIFGTNFVIFTYCYVKYRKHFFVAGENFANKLFIRSAKLTEIRSAIFKNMIQ